MIMFDIEVGKVCLLSIVDHFECIFKDVYFILLMVINCN